MIRENPVFNLAELCNPNDSTFLVGLFENWFRRSFIFDTFFINSGPPGWIREIKLLIFHKHQMVHFEECQDCQDCETDQDREDDKIVKMIWMLKIAQIVKMIKPHLLSSLSPLLSALIEQHGGEQEGPPESKSL